MTRHRVGVWRGTAAALLVAVLAGSSACGTEPSEPTFSFVNQVVFGVRTLPTEVTAGDRTMVVTGMLFTPGNRFLVSGTLASPARRALLVTVTGQATAASDPRYPDRNYYVGRIGGLARGDYGVKVLHVIAGTAPDTTVVFDAVVRIQ